MQQENLNNSMLNSFLHKQLTQFEFVIFYSSAHSLLNQFYPERTIKVKSRDPQYVTPEIKAKLRRKNRLMHAGRVEEAGALEERIGKDLERQSKNRLKTINGKTDVKDTWATVRQLTGRKQDTGPNPGISAESLNSHYVAISSYKMTVLKHDVIGPASGEFWHTTSSARQVESSGTRRQWQCL
jgi:hypothetical protein